MGSRFTVDDLIGLAPPPDWRVDAGSRDQWPEVEQALGTTLPDDYKLFINVYGSGEFNDLFSLLNPFAGSEHGNLLWQAGVPNSLGEEKEPGRVYPVGSILEHYQSLNAEFPGCVPFPFYPEPGGLLPLGGDSNGGTAFWLTGGLPDRWPLILLPHGLEPVERHDLSIVDFLVLWLSGELPNCFDGAGRDFFKRTDPVFRNFWKPSAE